jgi:cytochrome c biogenesis protein
MAFDVLSIPKRFYKTFANLRTGIILLILVVIAAALGTFILQRPTTELSKIQAAYSPQTLQLLDRLGLTDVFHSWWFITLLTLVSFSIVFVSLERFPNAWRYYARPYRKTDPHFRAATQYKVELPIRNADQGLNAAERALRKLHWPVQRITGEDGASLYSEKRRFSVMAVYVIHASLLLIFAGGIIDGFFGYAGFISLHKGQTGNVIELRTGGNKTLPFGVKCYSAGQENYADGSPKKWWSNLGIVDNGKETAKKEIVVNDPLVYKGLRFFQASYWIDNKKIDALRLSAVDAAGASRPIELFMNQPVELDPNTSVALADYISDAFIRDGQVFRRSDGIENIAFGLDVTDRATGATTRIWLLPVQRAIVGGDNLSYTFVGPTSGKDIDFSAVTGLEVAHEPGQWVVWTGCVLMVLGLFVAFYMVHMRLWVTAVPNANGGLMLWIGGAANKNKDRFEQKFHEVVTEIRDELGQPKDTLAAPRSAHEQNEEREAVLAGVR